jgi:hypothetical protein
MSDLNRKKIYQRYREKHREEIRKSARERSKRNWAEKPEEMRRKARERWAKNRERNRTASREYYQKNKKHRQQLARKYAKKIRKIVIDGYGGKCACCGENHQEFLAIHHINGGGTKERKRTHAHMLYRKIISHNFPSEYKVLCHNCNASLGHYGYCPHNLKSNKLT